jgi:hypothetical protein
LEKRAFECDFGSCVLHLSVSSYITSITQSPNSTRFHLNSVMDPADVSRQFSELRIALGELSSFQNEQLVGLREQLLALKAREDVSGLLSPTSVREVMDALRIKSQYRIVPRAQMNDFGWLPASAHISLIDNPTDASIRAPATPPSARESPICARKVLAMLPGAMDGTRRGTLVRITRIAGSKLAVKASLPGIGLRGVFSGAAAVPAQDSRGLSSGAAGSTVKATTATQPLLLFKNLPLSSKSGSACLAEAADLQPWFSRVLPRVDATRWKVNWVDGHKLHTIGPRKPDCVHYAHRVGDGDGAERSTFNIAYLGDWKSQKATGSGDVTEEELAHLLDFLMALARVQTWRRRFVGYLGPLQCW